MRYGVHDALVAPEIDGEMQFERAPQAVSLFGSRLCFVPCVGFEATEEQQRAALLANAITLPGVKSLWCRLTDPCGTSFIRIRV